MKYSYLLTQVSLFKHIGGPWERKEENVYISSDRQTLVDHANHLVGLALNLNLGYIPKDLYNVETPFDGTNALDIRLHAKSMNSILQYKITPVQTLEPRAL